MVDFSRSDRDGVEPLQPGWQGFGLPATGGEEVTKSFPHDELAGAGGAVRVTVAGNSHTRDYAAATGAFAAQSDLLSDGPLLNRPGIITVSFANLLDGVYELTTYHHTTQFGVSERAPATPFDIALTDATGENVQVASGLVVSDNSSASLTTHVSELTVSGGNEVRLNFARGPDNGPGDHFALAGFSLQLSGPPPPPLALGQIAYASTPDMQMEVIYGLENDKTNLVIFKTGGWFDRIDGIPSEQRHPIISQYIKEHYKLAIDISDTQILNRM